MHKLQNETREQAAARFNRDGGSEADYIRSIPLEMADGSTETLTHCQICLAHQANGVINHLHYCPFEGAAERLREAAPALLKACEAFVQAWKHSHQLEKTDVALRLAEAAIAAAREE